MIFQCECHPVWFILFLIDVSVISSFLLFWSITVNILVPCTLELILIYVSVRDILYLYMYWYHNICIGKYTCWYINRIYNKEWNFLVVELADVYLYTPSSNLWVLPTLGIVKLFNFFCWLTVNYPNGVTWLVVMNNILPPSPPLPSPDNNVSFGKYSLLSFKLLCIIKILLHRISISALDITRLSVIHVENIFYSVALSSL